MVILLLKELWKRENNMEDYLDGFLEYIRIERNYSDYTECNYELDIEKYEEYLDKFNKNFKSIKYKDVLDYDKYLKEVANLKATSINRHLSSLRSFYNYLEREGVIKSNPFKLVSGPKKEEHLPNYMKYSEFETMINLCEDTPLDIRNRALLETLFATGARIGELINININDIDFVNREVKVLGKGNKERICYLNEHACNSLENYINNSREILLGKHKSNRLFINHIGGNLTTRGVRDIIDNIVKKSALNIKVTPHTFRHTFATMLLNEGCDLKSVQELLGHANLSTTSIYTHLTNDYIKDIYLHAHPRAHKK